MVFPCLACKSFVRRRIDQEAVVTFYELHKLVISNIVGQALVYRQHSADTVLTLQSLDVVAQVGEAGLVYFEVGRLVQDWRVEPDRVERNATLKMAAHVGFELGLVCCSRRQYLPAE